jgi:D-3-phosphoglycerate dehydrogenase / 2-oxoglutarate reductase
MTYRYKVLISAPYMQPVIERFRPTFEQANIEIVLPVVHERLEEAELLQIMSDIDGVIAGDDRFTAKVIENSPKLKVLSKWGTGIDSFDKEACQKAGVAICNTVNAFSEPVADSVLGYMLSFVRRLPWMDKQMKAGIWDKIPGRSLRECTLGVIGVGNVGKAVIRRAYGFGIRILAADPVCPPPEFLEQYGVTMVSHEELLRQADFVTTNCDLNPTSHHLMSYAQFTLMKPQAVLINTARGPIIDEPALVEALQSGRIAGAALDVFEDEPLPMDSPLRNMDNVMLAPHNSNSSPEAWENVHHNTIRNLLEVLGVKHG